MDNRQRNQLIVSINEALNGRVTRNIRAISAALADDQVTVQYVHGEALKPEDKSLVRAISDSLDGVFDDAEVVSEYREVPAPVIYVEGMLPVVILALFEQNPDNFID